MIKYTFSLFLQFPLCPSCPSCLITSPSRLRSLMFPSSRNSKSAISFCPWPPLHVRSPAWIHCCVLISHFRFVCFIPAHIISLSLVLPFTSVHAFFLLSITPLVPPPVVPLVFKASNPPLFSFIHQKWSLLSASIISSISSFLHFLPAGILSHPPFHFIHLLSSVSLSSLVAFPPRSLTAYLTLIHSSFIQNSGNNLKRPGKTSRGISFYTL